MKYKERKTLLILQVVFINVEYLQGGYLRVSGDGLARISVGCLNSKGEISIAVVGVVLRLEYPQQ